MLPTWITGRVYSNIPDKSSDITVMDAFIISLMLNRSSRRLRAILCTSEGTALFHSQDTWNCWIFICVFVLLYCQVISCTFFYGNMTTIFSAVFNKKTLFSMLFLCTCLSCCFCLFWRSDAYFEIHVVEIMILFRDSKKIFLSHGQKKWRNELLTEDVNADKSPHHLSKPCQIFIDIQSVGESCAEMEMSGYVFILQ